MLPCGNRVDCYRTDQSTCDRHFDWGTLQGVVRVRSEYGCRAGYYFIERGYRTNQSTCTSHFDTGTIHVRVRVKDQGNLLFSFCLPIVHLLSTGTIVYFLPVVYEQNLTQFLLLV